MRVDHGEESCSAAAVTEKIGSRSDSADSSAAIKSKIYISRALSTAQTIAAHWHSMLALQPKDGMSHCRRRLAQLHVYSALYVSSD